MVLVLILEYRSSCNFSFLFRSHNFILIHLYFQGICVCVCVFYHIFIPYTSSCGWIPDVFFFLVKVTFSNFSNHGYTTGTGFDSPVSGPLFFLWHLVNNYSVYVWLLLPTRMCIDSGSSFSPMYAPPSYCWFLPNKI